MKHKQRKTVYIYRDSSDHSLRAMNFAPINDNRFNLSRGGPGSTYDFMVAATDKGALVEKMDYSVYPGARLIYVADLPLLRSLAPAERVSLLLCATVSREESAQ